MASSRSRDFAEEDLDETTIPLPEMMFAEGEEPVGVRVLTYQSSRALNTILEALDDDEIESLKRTSFGKLVEISEKPAFSGRFARYMLSRQLKVEKKHEAWFRFAGKPIRFSLREFAIVTGLPCGEFPKKSKSKKKKNMKEKPYWPELFGRVEETRVSRAVKMLRRKTVTNKDLRMKLACLAIVSSVLLCTNLRMKMLKEHAELLVDMEEFFSFPWERLAFDMLMTSIKKKDEISLSQNTIALKGFALALQLVIVEAVPSLTEVVQEADSSSESESDEEDGDRLPRKAKKQTLSPAHAREVDRKAQALVTSILPVDSARSGVDCLVNWSDDGVDVKVDNLVNLISNNVVIRKQMLRGGVSKVDVENMREKVKEGGKRNEGRHKPNEAPIDLSEESKIKALVDSIVGPEIHRLEGNISAAVASVKEVSSNALAYQASVVGSVDTILQSFKREMLSYFSKANTHRAVEAPDAIPVTNEVGDKEVSQNSTPAQLAHGVESRDVGLNTTSGPVIGVVESRVLPENILPAMRDSNEQIIDNVLENLSNYSTPPRSAKRCQGSEAESHRQRSPLSAGCRREDSKGQNETSILHSKKHMSAKQLSKEISEGSATYHTSFARKVRSAGCADGGTSQHASVCDRSQTPQQGGINAVDVFLQPEIPSFSLGLTQELGAERRQEAGEMGDNKNISVEEPIEAEVGDNEDTLSCRKSKRMRHVPPQLINGYQCGTPIVNRAREGQLLRMIGYACSGIRDKYLRLKLLLKKECVINVGGLSVTGKDVVDIGERNRFLPGRVIDILTRLVAFNVNNQALGPTDNIPVFLDSRVQVLLGRNYPKFKISKSKEEYVFTKGMVDYVTKSCPRDVVVARWYIPFNVHRRHWVGLCVDIPSSKIYVLDCNPGLIMDDALVKELLPISNMFPYLLRRLGNVVPTVGNKLVVERIKGVAQKTNPADAALTACLLIQAHALFGFDGCRSITPSVIPVEAQKAAIMVYEFNQKL